MALRDYLPEEGTKRFQWADDPDRSLERFADETEALIDEAAEVTPDDVAATLDDPAVADQLSANYASVVSARPAARVIVIGDSIENLYSYRTTANETFGKDWPTYAMLLSAGRFQLIRNVGVGGQSTDDYLARFDTDVVPSLLPAANDRANTVFIGGLENDIQEAIPLATSKANIKEMVRRARAHGAVPVLRTTMPHPLSAAVRKKIGAANHWIRNYGAANGIQVIDFWRAVVDPTNGQYLPAYSADGVHPNEAGAKLLGQVIVDTLCASIPVTPLNLAADPTDTGLLLPAPLFLTDVSGTPTSWNAIGGSPAGITRSMVTDPAVPGRMARITSVAGPAVNLSNNSGAISSTNSSPGDLVELCGVLTSDGGVQVTITATINYNDGTAKNLSRVLSFTSAITRGVYRFRLPPLPAGFQNVVVSLGVGAGTGQVEFNYPAARNLTVEDLL